MQEQYLRNRADCATLTKRSIPAPVVAWLSRHDKHMRARKMTTEQTNLTFPERIAKKGMALYDEKHRKNMEAEHNGEFAAIDVMGGGCYPGPTAEAALITAREAAPQGVFHLIRIGESGPHAAAYGWNGEHANVWAL